MGTLTTLESNVSLSPEVFFMPGGRDQTTANTRDGESSPPIVERAIRNIDHTVRRDHTAVTVVHLGYSSVIRMPYTVT